MVDFLDYTEGGIGALIGGVLVALGLKSKISNIEINHQEFKIETQSMFKEIRDDIKTLIEKSADRRSGDGY
jgi:hypothetical protein